MEEIYILLVMMAYIMNNVGRISFDEKIKMLQLVFALTRRFESKMRASTYICNTNAPPMYNTNGLFKLPEST